MDDSRWEQYAAVGGYLFVVLSVVSGFLPGSPPAADASTEEIAKYFNDHAGAIQAGQVMAGFGVVALAWWFGSLYRRMRAAEDGNPRLSTVAILGLAFGGAMALLSGAIASAVALRFDDFGPAGAHGLFTFSSVVIATAGFGVLAFLSAVCALNFRAHMFPVWTNFVGWLAALAFAVGCFGAGSDSAQLAMIGFAGFVTWCVWILAISTFMLRGQTAKG